MDDFLIQRKKEAKVDALVRLFVGSFVDFIGRSVPTYSLVPFLSY
jgi:hypothetical protein